MFGELDDNDPDDEDGVERFRGAEESVVDVESENQERSAFLRITLIWLVGESFGGEPHGDDCGEISWKLCEESCAGRGDSERQMLALVLQSPRTKLRSVPAVVEVLKTLVAGSARPRGTCAAQLGETFRTCDAATGDWLRSRPRMQEMLLQAFPCVYSGRPKSRA